MILYEYCCRLCGRLTEERRTVARRNRAAYCDVCDVWSGRRALTAPTLRGTNVSRN